MQWQQLPNAVQALVSDGVLTLNTTGNYLGSDDIKILLSDNGLTALAVSVTGNRPDGQDYVVTGTLSVSDFPYLSGSGTAEVSLRFSVDSGNAQVLIRITAPAGYTLNQSFAILNNSSPAELTLGGATLIFTSSGPAVPDNPTSVSVLPLYKGFNISATLTGITSSALTGPLSWFLSSVDSLPIQGPVVMKTGESGSLWPQMTLVAPLSGILSLPPFQMSIGIAARSRVMEVSQGDITYYSILPTADLLAEITTTGATDSLLVRLPMAAGNPGLYGFELDAPFPIGSLDQLATFAPLTSGHYAALLPPPLQSNAGLTLESAQLLVAPSLKKLVRLELGLKLSVNWSVIPGVVELEDIRVQFAADEPAAGFANMTARASAVFKVLDAAAVIVSMNFPSLLISGSLRQGDRLSFSQVSRQLLGTDISLPPPKGGAGVGANPTLTALDIQISPEERSVELMTEFSDILQINLSVIEIDLDSVYARFLYTPLYKRIELSAHFTITAAPGTSDAPEFSFYITGQRGTNWKGWFFEGGLVPGSTIDIVSLILRFMGLSSLPDNIKPLLIEQLYIWFDSGDQSYFISGLASSNWNIELDSDQSLKIAITAGVEIERDGKTNALSGTLSGSFFINRFGVEVAYLFEDTSETYLFTISFNDLSLTAALVAAENSEGQKTRLLTFSLSNFSLGHLIETLVSIARPDADYQLEAPWNILNSIDLSNFQLVIDLVSKEITVKYRVDATLPFMQLSSIGVTYYKKKGRGSVKLALEGSFLNQKYDAANPLAWDVLDDPPPAVPGSDAVFKLNYLGLGQHVALVSTADLDTVEQVIEALKAAMRPPQDSSENPLLQSTANGLRFDSSSSWLFGVDMSALGTIRLAMIFNDPYLYGGFIALTGKRAGPLAGLRFELLYKKVTDDIGVLKVDLRIPDEFRHLEFGEVSITLGRIHVDIYTNGDFLIDLGFPHNGNFAIAFGVQVFPFVGWGGIYFGKIPAAADKQLPVVSNGVFDPVIKFGLGLSIGLGKTFNKGPLSAGATITVEGILEGTYAFFTATDNSSPDGKYFLVKGSAALVGKVYGAVDFKVIRVDVSIVARAQISFVVESYQPIQVELMATVSVSASIKIWFIRIHFSFNITLDLGFTIGSASSTPWILGAPNTIRRRPIQLLREQGMRGPASWLPQRKSPALTVPVTYNWSPRAVLSGAPVPVSMNILPGFTIDGPGTDTAGSYKLVMMLMADATAYCTIAEAFLSWAISAIPGFASLNGSIDAVELDDLMAQLTSSSDAAGAFSPSALLSFLRDNITLTIAGIPDGQNPTGSVFPMLTPLSYQAGSADWVSFDSPKYDLGASYESALNTLFNQLKVNPASQAASDPAGEFFTIDPVAKALGAEAESMAGFVLRDALLMLTRTLVDAAINTMQSYPYDLATDSSLQSIIDHFDALHPDYVVRTDDTMESIAAKFFVSLSALYALNSSVVAPGAQPVAGDVLKLPVMVTAEHIVEDNQAHPLIKDKSFSLSGASHQVRGDRSLSAIAADYQITPASLVSNAGNQPGLLLDGASVPFSGLVYSTVANDGIALVAALWLTRQGLAIQDDETLWYAQAIANLNSDVLFPPAAGTSLTVPNAYNVTATATYTARSGDTIELIAQTLRLSQATGNQALTAYETAIKTANPGLGDGPYTAGISITIPDFTLALPGRSTLQSLADLLLLDIASLLPHIQGLSNILTPQAIIPLPAVTVTVKQGDTFSMLAARFDVSFEQLGEAAIAVQGIFDNSGANATVIISDVPAVNIAKLIRKTVNSSTIDNLVGQISRYLLHGLRLPDPSQANPLSAPLKSLYTLTGQQFDGPAPDIAEDFVITVKSGEPWISFTGGGDLSLTLTPTQISESYPQTTFQPDFTTSLSAMTLYQELPVRYALTQYIPWQTGSSVPAPVSDVLTGGPSLWPFPNDLLAYLSTLSGATENYELTRQAITSARSNPPEQAFTGFSWATLIEIRISKLAGSTYQVAGADQNNRDRMLALQQHLATMAGSANLSLLYQPPTDTTQPTGFVSVPLDTAGTFVVKSNMTTETRSGGGGMTEFGDTLPTVSGAPYAAPISDPANFVKLLWEASITNSGGFYLVYRGSENETLPSSLFKDKNEAGLWLLCVLPDQQSAGSKPLYGFNNAALLNGNLSTRNWHVYARKASNPPTTRHAIAPPGVIGFEGVLANPENSQDGEKLKAIRELYSLLGYSLQGSAVFEQSYDALPIGPQDQDSGGSTTSAWNLHHAFAVYQQAKVNALPKITGLPDPADDPYSGIGDNTQAQINFRFHDVYGNLAAGNATTSPLDLPVGYTDDLIAPAGLPGLSIGYDVSGPSSAPVLTIDMRLQILSLLPEAGASIANAQKRASASRLRYQQAYFQTMQKDVTASIQTTLLTPRGGEETPVEVNKGPVLDYIQASYILSNTVLGLTQAVKATTTGYLLQTFATDYRLSAAQIAEANSLQAADTVFAGAVNQPVYAMYRPGDTATSAAARLPVTVSATALLTQNPDLVFSKNLDLTLPPGLTSATTATTLTPRSFAARAQCSIGGLADANHATAGILAGGTTWYLQNASVTLPDTPGSEVTLDWIASKFSAQNIEASAADVLTANEDQTVFKENVSLAIGDTICGTSDTFSTIMARWSTPPFTLQQLASANTATVNLYPNGTSAYAGNSSATPVAGQLLGDFIDSLGVSGEQFIQQNLTTSLAAAANLIIPGMLDVPADGTVSLALPAGGGLSDFQTLTGLDAVQIAAANIDLPYRFSSGASLSQGGKTAEIAASDSFNEALATCQNKGVASTLQELVNLIEASPAVLRDGAVYITPGFSTPGNMTLSTLAQALGVSSSQLAAANAGTGNFIDPATGNVSYGGETLTVIAGDTLNSLTAAFDRALPDSPPTLAEFATANAQTLKIQSGKPFVVPPALSEIKLSITLPASPYPAGIFKLDVGLVLARSNINAVNPDFRNGAPDVISVVSHVPPLPAAASTTSSTLSLSDFAGKFETALPGLKVATGKRIKDANTDEREIWLVVFGDTGIKSISLNVNNVYYFGIQPLWTHLLTDNNLTLPVFNGSNLSDNKSFAFQAIDLESWAGTFLSAMDLMLSPLYAGPLYQLDNDPNSGLYAQIAAAKFLLTTAISGGVANILAGGGGELSTAKTKLRERLSISLSDTYGTDAIIQMPTTVQSNINLPDPAKLVCKPVVKRQLVPSGCCGLDQLAGHFRVTVKFLVMVLANTRKIITPDLNIETDTNPAHSYTTTDQDSLNSIAKALELNLSTLIDALHKPGNAHAKDNLFKVGAPLGITALSRKVSDESPQTLGMLAEYFNVAVHQLADANADTPEIFKNDATISYLGHGSVTVSDPTTATLSNVAEQFTPALTVDELSEAIRDETILNPAFTAYLIRLVPQHTLTDDKIELTPASPDTSTNYLFNIQDEAQRRKVMLDIGFDIGEVEYDIESVPGIAGYEKSHWLSFIKPLGGGADIPSTVTLTGGLLEIPVPLRAYPKPPSLLSQFGTLADTSPDTIPEAMDWIYSADLKLVEAQQDQLTLTITYNQAVPDDDSGTSTVPVKVQTLFEKMAAFIVNYPALQAILETLLTTGGDASKQKNAATAFATLATDIAGAWQARWQNGSGDQGELIGGNPDEDPVVEISYKVRTTIRPATIPPLLDTLVLTGEPTSDSFPDIFYLPIGADPIQLKESIPEQGVMTYEFINKATNQAIDIPATKSVNLRFNMPKRSLQAHQNALMSSAVVRNAFLVSSGPTASSFLYETPETHFGNALTPEFYQSAYIDVTPADGSIETALNNVFNTVLAGANTNRRMQLSVQYGYEITPGSKGQEPLISHLPVLYVPSIESSSTSDIASAILKWKSDNPVNTLNGRWIFELTIYSSLSNAQNRTLLTLTNLAMTISD